MQTVETDPVVPARHAARAPWLAYVLPMLLFLAATSLEGMLPRAWYPLVYFGKLVVVAGALLYGFPIWRDELRGAWRNVPLAVAVGLVVFALWVGLDKVLPYPHLGGSRMAYNPYVEITGQPLRMLFVFARFIGLAVLVPIMEEVFWRSFLTRYVDGYFTDKPFNAVPLGVFSIRALVIVSALFALSHPEWLVALLCGLAYGFLLLRTRDLVACIVAHSITNLALGVYVLTTGDWRYW